MKATMKKIASLTVAGGMLFSVGSQAFASDGTTATTQTNTTTTVQAGITPDSPFYTFDRLMENVQLFFTRNDLNRAQLLTEISDERKAELSDLVKKHNDGQLSQDQWQKLVNDVISNYKERLSQAVDELTKLQDQMGTSTTAPTDTQTTANSTDQTSATSQTDGTTATQTSDTTSANSTTTDPNTTDKVNAIATGIQSAADLNTDSLKGDDQATKDAEDIKAVAVLLQNGINQQQIKDLRSKGFGYGAIVHIFALSQASNKSIDDIVGMLDKHKGFGKLAKELGLKPSVLGVGQYLKLSATTSQSDQTNSSTTTDQNTTSQDQTQSTQTDNQGTQSSQDQTTQTQTKADDNKSSDQEDVRHAIDSKVNVGKVSINAKVKEHGKAHGKGHSNKKEVEDKYQGFDNTNINIGISDNQENDHHGDNEKEHGDD